MPISGSSRTHQVTLDLTRLLRDGQITEAEFDKLSRLGARATGLLALNILIGFGIISVSVGALALVPHPSSAIVIGLAVLLAGVGVLMALPRWQALGNMCLLVGTLMFAGGLVALHGPSSGSFLLMAVIFGVGSVLARSGLLTVLTLLALEGTLGGSTGYSFATYQLVIEQPAATVLVFSVLALGFYWLSKRIGFEYGRLASIAARAAVLLVNLGFWIGSLWGDDLTWLPAAHLTGHPSVQPISPLVFAIGWATALLGIGTWAARSSHRWVLNLVAVFAAIHFYTQWFTRLGATPASVLAAGILMLAFALAMWKWNERAGARHAIDPTGAPT